MVTVISRALAAAMVVLGAPGAPPHLPDAVLYGRTADVRAMIAGGADGRTALIKAASGGIIDVARVLLERGADMDVADRLERTASMYAATTGHEEMAALFKAARAKK